MFKNHYKFLINAVSIEKIWVQKNEKNFFLNVLNYSKSFFSQDISVQKLRLKNELKYIYLSTFVLHYIEIKLGSNILKCSKLLSLICFLKKGGKDRFSE